MLIDAGAPVGPDTVAPATCACDRRQLEAERRCLLGHLHTIGSKSTDIQSAKAVAAQIRLVAFGNELLQAGSRAVAVQNVIERFDRRLIRGPT